MTNSARILVTGAGGFLGRHLVPLLTSRGHRATAVSSQSEDLLQAVWQAAYPGHRADLVDVVPTERVLDTSFAPVDILVNAGFARVHHGEALAEALQFQADLLRKAAVSDVRRVLNLSSQSVYDTKRGIAALESDRPAPSTPYATAKFAQETLASVLLGDAELVQIRLASLIGVGFDQRVVNKLTETALSSHRLSIVQNDAEFDFMDVRDAAHALSRLCSAALSPGETIVNVGSNQPRSLVSIAETVAAVVTEQRGFEVEIEIVDSPGERVSSALNCTRLFQDFAFSPTYDLKSTIADLVAASTARPVCNR